MPRPRPCQPSTLCHGYHDVVMALEDDASGLDALLNHLPNYRHDYMAVVLTAEQNRFHTRDLTLTSGHGGPPCAWCIPQVGAQPGQPALHSPGAA